MRKGLVIAISAVVVLGGSYAWLTIAKPFGKQASQVVTVSGSKVLIAADISKIERVAVKRPGEKAHAFVRKGDVYSLEGRPEVMLSNNAVVAAFSAVSSLEATGIIDAAPRNPAEFGLGSPGLVVVGVAGRAALGLEIGDRSPGGEVYVRLPGTTAVYAVSSNVIQSFYGALDDFRDRSLPAIDTQNIKYLRIKRGGGGVIEIEDRPSEYDDFYMTSMYLRKPFRHRYPVRRDGFDALVKAMPARLSIQGFVDDPKPLAEYGLESPIMDLSMGDGASTLRLLTGKPAAADTVYAKLPDKPQVFTVRKASVDFAVKADAFALANHLPLLVPIDRVEKLSFRAGDKTFLCEIKRKELPRAADAKSGDKAEYEATYTVNGGAIDEGAFKRIYQTVIGITFEGANPKALDAKSMKVEATVTFWQSGGRPTRNFEFVSANSDFYALLFEGDAEFLITKSQVKDAVTRLETEFARSRNGD